MYKNYIFDLYGTLVDIRTNENSGYLWKKMQEFYGFHGAEYSSVELKRLYARLCKQEEKKAETEGFSEIQIEKVFDGLFREKNVIVSDDTIYTVCEFFRIISTKYVKLYDGVIELFEELKKKDKKIYLLSNAQRVFTEPEIKYLGIWDYFDGIFISSNERYKKPSSEFFNALIKKYGLNVKESIMIGNDGTSDIEGACRAGMDSLYIRTDISPQGEKPEDVGATYVISDGDFTKIGAIVLK
ncbi:MAG: HAD family hydrolase [Lachnospiraceae bacterium]|nr:HAD family hydrolase [Lachnospiraceae bacterium]